MSITKTSILALAFAGIATAAFAESDDNASSAAVWAGLAPQQQQSAIARDIYASAAPHQAGQHRTYTGGVQFDAYPQNQQLPTQDNN